MTLSNYPHGFENGVSIRGLPILSSYSGNLYWVNSVSGSDSYNGSKPSTPYATTAKAVAQCTADHGDIVILQAGHAETFSAANALTLSTAGVAILGLGKGADRPQFTFGTSAAASILISAASCSIENVVGLSGIDQLTGPILVQAADTYLDIEWRDTANNVEAISAIIGNASANRLDCNLTYQGRTGGSHATSAIVLNGSAGANLNLHCYGKWSTAVVNFVTAAVSNVSIKGSVYNSGTTDGSKDVVDTATGSTWYINIDDQSAGYSIVGGSAAALAGAGNPAGNKNDTAAYFPGTTSSLMAYIKGAVDLMEKATTKAAATIVNGQTLFTVAGGPIEIISLASVCVTNNDTTASTLQYSVTPTVGSAQTISAASASLASALAGASVVLAGTALTTAALLNANGPNLNANPGTIFCPAGTITAVVGVGSTVGTWAHYIRYRPLAKGVTVS